MEIEDLKKLKKARFRGTKTDFKLLQEQFKEFDIVYDIQSNAGVGYHLMTIYKRPKELTDWEVAYAVDGFFFSVDNCGGQLKCWYD